MRRVFPMHAIALAALLAASSAQAATALPVHDGIGGDFTAESSLGRRVSLSEYRGKVVLLFFGYTSCPDVCPVTLAHLRTVVGGIGRAADDVQVLLITVDPENDTAEHLAQYLARFHSGFVGVTGKREEIDRIAELFMVKHHQSHGTEVTTEYNRSKAFTEKAYLVSHSQQIYLLDKAGRTRALFFAGSPVGEMQEAILALLREESIHVKDDDCKSEGADCLAHSTPQRAHEHEGEEE
jgi:protein SCO1/2